MYMYMYKKKNVIVLDLAGKSVCFTPPPPSRHLSELCVDERAAVRKSASQTLFSTLSAHGTLLQSAAWDHVLWQVRSHVTYHVIVM